MLTRIAQLVAAPTAPKPARRTRLSVERLEDRTVPATFNAATVTDLVADINAANQSAEADTITLAPGKTFSLKQAYDISSLNGLPVIEVAGGNLNIVGNGDIIERKTAPGVPSFRLFYVAGGASLTLSDASLQGGLTLYGGGGAIYNGGSLTLQDVTVQKNAA
jgi:hypothetical protein